MMGASTVAASVLTTALVILCELHTARTQTPASECGTGLRYCGAFCCPNNLNTFQTVCCPNSLSCCEPAALGNDTTIPQCGDQRCPTTLPPSEVYDSDEMLRNQCCKYFREGCCSAEENRLLDLLFKVAIGIGAAIFVLLVIIGLLVTCCVCVFCLS